MRRGEFYREKEKGSESVWCENECRSSARRKNR